MIYDDIVNLNIAYFVERRFFHASIVISDSPSFYTDIKLSASIFVDIITLSVDLYRYFSFYSSIYVDISLLYFDFW